MKAAAILMTIVMLVAFVGVGWLYLSSTVRVEALGAIATEASAQQPTFDRLKEEVAEDRLIGTLFRRQELGESTDYQFLTYTVRLRNDTLLPVDMVEVQVTPMDQDVLQLGTEEAYALPRRSTGDISATILTDRDSHAVRELNITYYIWGLPFSLRTAYGH